MSDGQKNERRSPEAPPEAGDLSDGKARAEACLASTTIRDEEHQTYNCALDAGHSGAHRSGDGTVDWTDGDTFLDDNPTRNMARLRVDDKTPCAGTLRSVALYLREWIDGDDAWHAVAHIAPLFAAETPAPPPPSDGKARAEEDPPCAECGHTLMALWDKPFLGCSLAGAHWEERGRRVRERDGTYVLLPQPAPPPPADLAERAVEAVWLSYHGWKPMRGDVEDVQRMKAALAPIFAEAEACGRAEVIDRLAAIAADHRQVAEAARESGNTGAEQVHFELAINAEAFVETLRRTERATAEDSTKGERK